MGTSRSSEEGGWIGGVLVYSGRRDPTWPVPAELGHRLEQLWEGLPPWSGRRPQPPPLGFRGWTLTAPDGRVWTAFRQLVALAIDGRRDAEREFERSLIASAPPGIVPTIAL
ncbi:MAG TPA: hypothetical protein VGS16_01090 [Candidatus Dormibacteraeota bacterium]|nr:hypothetical protein [Candidatus Dormibacteraeota bacterium]